jgi:hypothetical protein
VAEDFLYRFCWYPGVIFLCYAAQVVKKVRLWDLGVGSELGKYELQSAALGPALLLGTTFFRGSIWLVAGCLVTYAALAFGYGAFARSRKGPVLEAHPLTGFVELTDSKGPPVVVGYRSADELVRWLDKWQAIVIPSGFAEGAPQAEVQAIGVRQTLEARGMFFWIGLAVACLPVYAGFWAGDHRRPLIAILAFFASLACEVVLFHWALRREDRRLDRAAVALTKDPEAYIQAIERATRTLPFTPTFPFWFRRDSIEARAAAIRSAIKV